MKILENVEDTAQAMFEHIHEEMNATEIAAYLEDT